MTISKVSLLENPVHDLPFLEWLQAQASKMTEYANMIEDIVEEGAAHEVVSLAKVNRCLATYTAFYTTQTAFYQIYKHKLNELEKTAGALFDNMYYDIKKRATDKNDEIGARYIKKAATMDEIRREISKFHPQSRQYNGLKNQISTFFFAKFTCTF